jgi:hypothetical protein
MLANLQKEMLRGLAMRTLAMLGHQANGTPGHLNNVKEALFP